MDADRLKQASEAGAAARLLGGALEAAANGVLRLDPLALERFAQLDGQVIRLELTDFGLTLDAVPSASGLRLSAAAGAPAEVTLRGTLAAFSSLILSEGTIVPGTIELTGNLEVGRRFEAALRGLEPQWEEALARRTGDVVAHRLGNLARGAGEWLKQAAATLRQDTTEFLQEEARLLPARPEVERLLGQIDRLRADADRLEARVQRLRRRMP